MAPNAGFDAPHRNRRRTNPLSDKMKVNIIGAGIAGLSLAWALRRRGVDVTVFDRGAIPNPVSSSFDEHRITRHTYAGLDGYGALMVPTFAVYEQLWRDLGRSHYLPTGMVYISRVTGDFYSAAATELDELGIGHRVLQATELERRFPFLNLGDVQSAFEAEGAGMLFAGRIVSDLAAWLAENGVDLRPHSRVTDVDIEAGTLVVDRERHHADVVVIAAGAWISDLLPKYAVRTVASRQLVLYLDPPERHRAAWANAPVLVDMAAGQGAYILPPRDGTRLKIGDHVFTRRGHGSDDRVASEADIEPVAKALKRAFRDPDSYRVLERKVCYYTVTADERFVVEPIGTKGWVLSACSGHGFKLGPLVGDRLARTLLGEFVPAETTRYLAGLGV